MRDESRTPGLGGGKKSPDTTDAPLLGGETGELVKLLGFNPFTAEVNEASVRKVISFFHSLPYEIAAALRDGKRGGLVPSETKQRVRDVEDLLTHTPFYPVVSMFRGVIMEEAEINRYPQVFVGREWIEGGRDEFRTKVSRVWIDADKQYFQVRMPFLLGYPNKRREIVWVGSNIEQPPLHLRDGSFTYRQTGYSDVMPTIGVELIRTVQTFGGLVLGAVHLPWRGAYTE